MLDSLRISAEPRGIFCRIATLVVMGCLALAFFSKANAAPPPTEAAATAPVPYKPALPGAVMGTGPLDIIRSLAVGDRLSFRVMEEGGEPYILTVASSGEVDFPFVGRVRANGRTCKVVADEVRSLLEKTFYRKATVSLALETASTLPMGTYFVTGQVMKQGAQEIPRDREVTVAAAILEAGGFADFADRRRVRLIRPSGDGSTKRFTVDVKAVLERGDARKDMIVQPGDYVVVPERMFNF